MNTKKLVIGIIFIMMVACVHGEISDSKAIVLSLVNQDPDPSIAGDTVEIRIGVENKGGESAENLIIELIVDYRYIWIQY